MLERLSPRPGARHRTKRVGRGPGSGHGKTSTRGVKGQGKRNETAARHSEGGQNPLVRRIPKRGFRPRGHVVAEVVNLGDLAGFAEGARVDAAALLARGLIRGKGAPVKLLADGEAPRGLVVCVDRASAAARAKVEAAGGRVEIAGGKVGIAS